MVLVTKTMSPGWLSNTYLVIDRPQGHGVLIDTGGPSDPILKKIKSLGVTITHVLCTHHHYDHVAFNNLYKRHLGCPICGHTAERSLFTHLDHELRDGEELQSGDLHIRALHIPGHTLGQLAFLVNEDRIFTGDTLFRGSVGGTRGPGHTTFEDLRHSIMEVLMRLPESTIVHPGHTDPTTIGREWSDNPFIRAWRGLDRQLDRPCTAMGRPATLLVQARDYDGGTKCQVRFNDDGEEAVVGGSRVAIP